MKTILFVEGGFVMSYWARTVLHKDFLHRWRLCINLMVG